MKTQNIEEIPLEELEKKLNEYKTNLSQVEVILEREKTNNPQSKLDELYKLQKDLKQAIIYQEDVIKFKQQNCDTTFSNIVLSKQLNGKICLAYYETEKKWFNALINVINETDQIAEVTYLGYKEKESLAAKYIKTLDSMSVDEIEVGMFCEAIYYDDGLWYPCVIEIISEHGVHIRFKKFNETEVVSFESIRITPEQKIQNDNRKNLLKKKREPEDELEFIIPDNLKISPADSETQRLTKKKKLKALKNNHKQKLLEKISKEKQDEWLNFSQKNSKNKLGGFGAYKRPDLIARSQNGELQDNKPTNNYSISNSNPNRTISK